jgi:hypothetical protein
MTSRKSIASSNGLDIILNVYDLHDSNSYLYCVGTGFYHTGIQIEGFEYCFSSHGVVRTRPRDAGLGKFREAIHQGKFSGSMRVVKEIMVQMRKGTFAPGQYHILKLNCNHFSDALVNNLLGTHIPSWINRLAEMGATFAFGTNIEMGNFFEQESISEGNNGTPPLTISENESLADGANTVTSDIGASSMQALNMFSSSISSMFSVLCFAPSADMVCDEEAFIVESKNNAVLLTSRTPESKGGIVGHREQKSGVASPPAGITSSR